MDEKRYCPLCMERGTFGSACGAVSVVGQALRSSGSGALPYRRRLVRPSRRTSIGERRPALASESPVVMRCISDASEPIPSPKVATFFDALAMFLVVLLRGIGTPSTRLRELRPASIAPPASPASPVPAAIRGTFAFFTASATVLPAETAPSFAVAAASATGPWLLGGVERLRGVVRLRAVEVRFCVLPRESVPLDRELLLREVDTEPGLPLRDRLEVERFVEPLLEFLDRRVVC